MARSGFDVPGGSANSLWDYVYDDRYRLDLATRSNAAPPNDTIQAVYDYTYDDADNLVTKVAPFEETFNDEDLTGWTKSGTWDALNGNAHSPEPTSWVSLKQTVANDDLDLRFRYRMTDPEADGTGLSVAVRDSLSNRLSVEMRPGMARLTQRNPSFTSLDLNNSAGSALDTWYEARFIADGTHAEVWLAEEGEQLVKVLESDSVTLLSGSEIRFLVSPGMEAEFDDIRLIGTSLVTTTTYTYDACGRRSTLMQSWSLRQCWATISSPFARAMSAMASAVMAVRLPSWRSPLPEWSSHRSPPGLTFFASCAT